MAGESTVAADCATHSDSVNSAQAPPRVATARTATSCPPAQTKAMEASLAKAMAAKG